MAEAENVNAQHNLALCYSKGTGVAVDHREALKWHRRVAENGLAFAQDILGEYYLKGEGIAVDKVEAFKWYKRAAEAGHKEAMLNLGVCFVHGNGTAVDMRESLKWSTRAETWRDCGSGIKIYQRQKTAKETADDRKSRTVSADNAAHALSYASDIVAESLR